MKFERHIHDLVNSLQEGILVLDERQHVILKNRAAEKILGVKINLKASPPFEDCIGGQNKEFHQFVASSFTRPGARNKRDLTYHKNNRDHRFQVLTFRRRNKTWKGGFVFIIAISDVTKIWKLHDREKGLLSQIRKNYINQIENLRHIAESVAHEVRNPIVSIGGYTNLLIKKCATEGERGREYKKYLTYIKEDSDRLFRIVNEVEKYSDLSEISLHRENCAVLIRNVLSSTGKFAGKKGIAIETAGQIPDEYYMYVDRAKLKTALANVMRYAILLSDARQPVLIDLSFTSYDVNCVIEISTDIPKEEAPFLLNPFSSALGQKLSFNLAVSQRIVILHGGIIKLLWRPGNLLSFIVTLPREKRLGRS